MEPIFIIDKREIDNLMENVIYPKLKKIAILHNNHYKSPYKMGAEIKPSFKFLLNNNNLFDKIVCLTKGQKDDLESEFHLQNKIEVITHTVRTLIKDYKVTIKQIIFLFWQLK